MVQKRGDFLQTWTCNRGMSNCLVAFRDRSSTQITSSAEAKTKQSRSHTFAAWRHFLNENIIISLSFTTEIKLIFHFYENYERILALEKISCILKPLSEFNPLKKSISDQYFEVQSFNQVLWEYLCKIFTKCLWAD